MWEKEIIVFVVLVNLVILILIGGVILFIYQYRKRQIRHGNEMVLLAEMHQKQLLSAQIDAQKETMVEIGKELHDNVGQKVTLASIYLQQIPYKQPENIELAHQVTEVNSLLNEMLSELRKLSRTLVEQENFMGDFAKILKDEFKKIEEITHIKINFTNECQNIDLWTMKERNAIFRILQEFIQNSLKHGKSSLINITFLADELGTRICAKDNGIGFEMDKVVMGIGITNLKRRAHDIGGKFEIRSTPGIGTEMILKLLDKSTTESD